jgi:hypothetical protein
MGATAALVVDTTFMPTPLAEHLVLTPGLDPIWTGATGYLDDVFTTRTQGSSL